MTGDRSADALRTFDRFDVYGITGSTPCAQSFVLNNIALIDALCLVEDAIGEGLLLVQYLKQSIRTVKYINAYVNWCLWIKTIIVFCWLLDDEMVFISEIQAL